MTESRYPLRVEAVLTRYTDGRRVHSYIVLGSGFGNIYFTPKIEAR